MRTVKVTAAALLALGCAGWGVGGAEDRERDGYRIVTWSTLSNRDFSPLVRLVQEREGAHWRYAESDRVIAHAASVAELAVMMEEAHHAWQVAGRQLALPEPRSRVRLVPVYQAATWEQLGKEAGIRPDGLALQAGPDILLKQEASQTSRLDRVAHELVHFRLREAYGDALPLWLEEGLATSMGVSLARAFHDGQGILLAGTWPAAPAEALLEPDALLNLRDYPPSPGAAQAFGRQAAELVQLLRERIGADRWPMAVREIGQRGDWRSVLASGYGVDVNEVKQMAARAAALAVQPWVF